MVPFFFWLRIASRSESVFGVFDVISAFRDSDRRAGVNAVMSRVYVNIRLSGEFDRGALDAVAYIVE